jgi:hypothetical protein
MGHVKALEKTSCKYLIRRVKVKVDTVPRGNMNYVQDNMFLGQLPKRLVIACVNSDVECQSLAYSLCTVVKQDLSVSTDFDHVVKFCIHDEVNGCCQSFGEMNLHT